MRSLARLLINVWTINPQLSKGNACFRFVIKLSMEVQSHM